MLKKSLEQYEGDMADMLAGIGHLCYELKIYDKALQLYTEAIKDLREVTEKNSSDQNLSYLAIALNDLADVCDETKNYAKAEQAYEEAQGIQTQLAEKDPFKYFPQLAKVDNGFGNVYFHLHNYQQAGLHYDRALKNYKKLTEKNPGGYILYG